MVDICKCINKECELKDECYRFTAPSSERQLWGYFEPVDGKCEYFMRRGKCLQKKD